MALIVHVLYKGESGFGIYLTDRYLTDRYLEAATRGIL